MSSSKICDRCGKVIKFLDPDYDYSSSEAWRYTIVKDCHPYPDQIKIDLCNDCKEDLIKWLKKWR